MNYSWSCDASLCHLLCCICHQHRLFVFFSFCIITCISYHCLILYGDCLFVTDNAIPIESWYSDPHDVALLNLLPLLDALRFVNDVRSVLSRNLHLEHRSTICAGSM